MELIASDLSGVNIVKKGIGQNICEALRTTGRLLILPALVVAHGFPRFLLAVAGPHLPKIMSFPANCAPSVTSSRR
jgi:hypothetical protein